MSDLNDFSPAVRRMALERLHAAVQEGDIILPEPADVANMHCHTFFSYNAYGYSPSGLAWLAKSEGYKWMGIVDFDVLDAVDEWLAACDLLALRGSAGMETRVFLPEFAGDEINSPGEPGVTYHMGIGFTSSAVPAPVTPIAARLREQARLRNMDVMARVNAFLDPIQIDYQADVLPLTPEGVATERHMVYAYVKAVRHRVPDARTFWADKLGMDEALVEDLMGASGTGPGIQNIVRSKLMKRGGVGYVHPGPDTFPTIDQFHDLIVACGALPCAAWLDGTSAGEGRMEDLLTLLIDKGVVALNIIPDRNWDIADPVVKGVKLRHLYEVVALARHLDLPLNVGTEMNSFGNKLIDDFAAPELAPLKQPFLEGAAFIYGHTRLQRARGLGYQSDWAQAYLPARRERNRFYTLAGTLIPPGKPGSDLLHSLPADLGPSQLLAHLDHPS